MAETLQVCAIVVGSTSLSSLAPMWISASTARALQETAVSMIASTGEARAIGPAGAGRPARGFVSGNSYPDKWSATENVLWKVAVPGDGNSSPVVWGDRFSSPQSRWRTPLVPTGLSRSDGQQLWEAFAPEGRLESVHKRTAMLLQPSAPTEN